MNKKQLEKKRRMIRANHVIYIISQVGRKFFNHKGEVSRIEMDHNGRLWYFDAFSRKKIYLHCAWSDWRGFTEGGTLENLVKGFKHYIMTGEKIRSTSFGPWPDWICDGDLWGYGDDIKIVRDTAIAMKIIEVN